MLDGKKTYIIGVLIIFATVAKGMGWLDQNEFFTLIGLLNAGGIASLRSAINK